MRRFLARRGDRGAAAVEFALVLPLVLLIVLGILEFAMAMMLKTTLAAAAREGARSYAIHGVVGSNAAATPGAATRVSGSALGGGLVLTDDMIFLDVCATPVGGTAKCNNTGGTSPVLYTAANAYPVSRINAGGSLSGTYASTPICPNSEGYVVVAVRYPWNLLGGRTIFSTLMSLTTGRANLMNWSKDTYQFVEASTMRCGG